MTWTHEQLTWYLRDKDFETEPWWEEDPKKPTGTIREDLTEDIVWHGQESQVTLDQVGEEDPKAPIKKSIKSRDVLRAGARERNQQPVLRLGPIYWETLRRHPDLPVLVKAIGGTDSEFPTNFEIRTRLELLPKPQAAILFYLTTLYQRPWRRPMKPWPKDWKPLPQLPRGVQSRFEKFLPEFLRLTPGTDGGNVVRTSNSVTDLLSSSATELGQLMAVSGYLHNVEVADLHKEVAPVESATGSSRTKVLDFERLEESLREFGLELMLIAIDPKISGAAAADDFRRVYEEAFPGRNTTGQRQHRLNANRLKEFSWLDEKKGFDDHGRKKWLSYFNEVSFDGVIEIISRAGK